VYAALGSLGVVGVSSAVLCVLCVQVLLSVQYYGYVSVDDRWSHYSTSHFLSDVAATLCVVAFSLSICAFFCSTFELFLCLKVLKMSPDSHMRIMRFLREAMFIRFLAFFGFFVSIPLFLLAVLTTMLSANVVMGSFASTGVLIVVVLVALIICIAVMAHGVYAWLLGSLKLPDL
uniref:Transmembrane protein n=1 Tax=Plectus sambesii TaxID=2011161 RepID=A0A914V8N2_9BILA